MQFDISFTASLNSVFSYFPEVEADSFLLSKLTNDSDCYEYPVLFLDPATGRLTWRFMAWGCLPFDVTDALLPARSWAFMRYTLADRILEDTKSYWHRIRDQRCLVAINGLYVHRMVHTLQHKIPYFVHDPDQPVLFLPCLYSADEAIDITTGMKVARWVFTIVSRPANSLIRHLQPAWEKNKTMPLLLTLPLSRRWLGRDLSEADYRAILDFEMLPEALQAWPLYSTQTDKQRPDKKERNERFDWQNLPPLNV